MTTGEGQSERWLVAIAQERDRTAFAQLFGGFAPRLKGFFLKNRLAQAQAEELAQEVMLRVWHKAEHFDPSRGTAATWIFALARNVLVDMVRREARPLPDAEALADTRAPVPPDAETAVAGAQSVAALRGALADLPAEQREILEDSYFGGRSLSEVATHRGLPLGTVKTRARLALQRLRLFLGTKESHDA